MSIKITGEETVLRELESRLTGMRAQAIHDSALQAGAEVFVKELERQFETFKDTGASIAEITLSKPHTVGGERRITVHWRGPKKRYRLIHLNEHGTVNNPKPRGKGAIARAMRNSERAYRAAVKKEMEAIGRG